MLMKNGTIQFPAFTGTRCLMMPFVQGHPESVGEEYQGYADIIRNQWINHGDIGYLTIDESIVEEGRPHRGYRSKAPRALHTEAGRYQDSYQWGNSWGTSRLVTLDDDVEILLANSLDDSCGIWNAWHEDTSLDGDIGYAADTYPYEDAVMMKAGEVYRIGILTPHESLRVSKASRRQFLRIVSSGVHGREPYFTENNLLC